MSQEVLRGQHGYPGGISLLLLLYVRAVRLVGPRPASLFVSFSTSEVKAADLSFIEEEKNEEGRHRRPDEALTRAELPKPHKTVKTVICRGPLSGKSRSGLPG